MTHPKISEAAATRVHSRDNHDATLHSRISSLLAESPAIDATDVSIVVQNRSVTLFGSAPSEAQKVLIQALASGISGVVEVRNRLKIAEPMH